MSKSKRKSPYDGMAIKYKEPESHIKLDFTADDAADLMKMNIGNRPKSSPLAKRYANEMLRRKWEFNGEPIILTEHGVLASGQHRCEAIIIAEKLRKADPARWKKYWKGPIKIAVAITTGIKKSAVNTLDLGKSRSQSDVLFRQTFFDEYLDADGKQEFSDADKKKLARQLATATRNVWIRLGGMKVSDSPKFPHSEMMDFLKVHPSLVDMTVHVFRANERKEGLIDSLISLANMTTVAYLMAASDSKRDEYDETSEYNLDKWDAATLFVDKFADSAAGLPKGNPITVLRQVFTTEKANGAVRDRDVLFAQLVMAANAFLDGVTDEDSMWEGDPMTTTMFKFNPKKDDMPRIGGLDVYIEEEEEDEPEEAAEKPAKKKATKKAAKKVAKKSAKKASKKKPAAEPEPEDGEWDDDEETEE